MNKSSAIGAVVIGRNEGQRLLTCLESLRQEISAVVYVDSGSTDGSVTLAEGIGVSVVNLDLTQPFTAARARNAGFRALLQIHSDLEYIQFVDGDCQVVSGWIASAMAFMATHNDYAVVCGRRRERFPEHSVYNLLCDIEWDTPIGDAMACGGDAVFRVGALSSVNGYRDDLIAGEEPELCFRLRENGWKIYRMDHEMTLHDAAIFHFSQWWQRSKRAGFAFAAVSALHGTAPERMWRKETRSIVIWGCVLPFTILFAALALNSWWLLGLTIYPAQVARIGLLRPVVPNSRRVSLIYAFFVMLAKFPQASGVASFLMTKILSKNAKLIEYK